MRVEKILIFLEENEFHYQVVSMKNCAQIEKVAYEPRNIDAYHDGAICVCSKAYYNSIEGHYRNILYFVLKSQNGESFEDNLNFADNLVVIHDPVSPYSLFQKVDEYIHNNFRIDNAYSQIGQCLLEGQDVESLLKVGAKLVGNPVVLLDISTKALCFSSRSDFEVLDDELLQCILEHGFVTADLFYKYNYEALLPEIGSMEKAKIFHFSYEKKLDRITARVLVNNSYFGMLVIPESTKTLETDDPVIADIIANGVSILLDKQQVAAVSDNIENIFIGLLSSSYSGMSEFLSRTGGFNWNPELPVRIAAIRPKEEKLSQSILAFRNHLALILPFVTSAFYKNTLFLLIEEKSLSYILNTLSTFFKLNQLTAGFSQRFSHILECPFYAAQAKTIRELGAYLDADRLIYHFDQYMLHYNAYILKENGCADSYILPELKKAREYDWDYDTQYCRSVRTWLDCRNLADAAKAMGIHRNTMVYRIDKFQSITGLDLSQGNTIYKLNLAFHLWDLEGFSCPETGIPETSAPPDTQKNYGMLSSQSIP